VDYQTTMLEKTTQIADNTAKMADKANIDSTSMFDPSKLNLENTNSITTTPTTIDLTSKPAANDSSTNTAETIAELKLSNEQLAQLVVETRALVTVQAEANATVVAQLTDLVSTSQEDTFNNRMRALAG